MTEHDNKLEQHSNHSNMIQPNTSEIESSNQNESSSATVKVALAAAATAALVASPSANASIGGILDDLVNKFVSKFQPLITDVMGSFSDILNTGQKESSSKVIQASIEGMDSIIHSLQKIEEEKLKRAAAPPPDYCQSDAIGIASKKADQSAKEMFTRISSDSISSYSNSEARGLGRTKISGLTERFSSNNQQIGLAHIANSSKLSTEEERNNAIASVELLTAGVADTIRLNSSDALSDNRLNRINYINQSSKAISLELARSAFYGSIADRSANGGQHSKLELYLMETDRTYGSKEWRDSLNEYVDPTPLLIELAKLQALNNRITLDQLTKTEQQNLLISSQLINRLRG
ncbi:hypothetical protein QXB71_002595 [Vibrio cholerae]|nr:hypothetical protein [Vibrio cholerae]ELO1827358.1 hypothetical protein [Vibrio cholerae]